MKILNLTYLNLVQLEYTWQSCFYVGIQQELRQVSYRRYVEDEWCLLPHIDCDFLQHVVNLSLQSGQPEVEGVGHSTSRQVAGGCNAYLYLD